MKNMLVLIVLFLASTQTGYSQFALDISAGLNQSSIEFQNLYYQTTSRSSYFIGVSPSIGLNKKLRVFGHLQFSQKGFHQEELDFIQEVDYRYSYLDFIPELEYRFLRFLRLGVGFNAGMKISEAYKISGAQWENTSGVDFIKNYDFGLTGKLGVEVGKASIFVRYNHGLANINEITYSDILGEEIANVRQYNRNVQIGVAYRIKGNTN